MTEAVPSVLDIPIWEDCPFRGQISDQIEIRKGQLLDKEVLAFWWPQQNLCVSLDYDSLDLETLDRTVELVLSNLTGAAFEKEYPGIFQMIVNAKARQALGHEIPTSLKPPLRRLEVLDAMIPRARPPAQAVS